MTGKGNGVKVVHNGSLDATDVILQVEAKTHETYEDWDRDKIVGSILAETDLSERTARDIAIIVEGKVEASSLDVVSTDTIRELIDGELLSRGYTRALRQYAPFSIPFASLESLMFGGNKENSNQTPNPESVNLSVAEMIFKEYALREVFSGEVADAHRKGDIHLHDLGFISRPYTFSGDTQVVRSDNGCMVSLRALYDVYPLETSPESDTWIKFPKDGLRIAGIKGPVSVKRLVRRCKRDKKMVFVRLENGRAIVVTDDHPMIVCSRSKGEEVTKEVPAGDLQVGMNMLTGYFPQAWNWEATEEEGEGLERLNVLSALPRKLLSKWDFVSRLGEKMGAVEAWEHLDAGRMDESDLEWGHLVYSGAAIPALLPLSEDLGWIVGNVVIGKCFRQEGAVLALGPNEDQEKTCAALHSVGVPYICHLCDGKEYAHVYSPAWAAFLESAIGAGALPKFFPQANEKFLAGLLAGIMDGAGVVAASPREYAHVEILTDTIELASQLYAVATWFGLKASVCCIEGRGVRLVLDSRMKRDIYGLRIWRGEDVHIPSRVYNSIPEEEVQEWTVKWGGSRVAEVRGVDTADPYIYDVTTEGNTFLANGIHSHNCGGHSLEYVKKYGLKLPNITSSSKPARHAGVLVGHMVKMASTLQSFYAGAVGWDAVNVFFAPFFRGMSFDEVKQVAQMLIFEFNQLAGARGAQVVFSDFNLYGTVPKHFRDTPAMGPGGKYCYEVRWHTVDSPSGHTERWRRTVLGVKKGAPDKSNVFYEYGPRAGLKAHERITPKEVEGWDGIRELTYADYEGEAQTFLEAMFSVYLEGDAHGATFFFPKPLLHISESCFESKRFKEEIFPLACKVASIQGITYFVFDRGDEITVSQCCRLKLKLSEQDLEDVTAPEKMRFSALQNITINLPRVAFKIYPEMGLEGWRKKLPQIDAELERLVDLTVTAHKAKKRHIRKLISLGKEGMLSLFVLSHDGKPYLQMDRLTYLVGVLGLNEMVQHVCGQEMHESDEAYKLGIRIISKLNSYCSKVGKENNMNLVLEESPAESACYRLASLDLREYPERAKAVVKGSLEKSQYYYTNSVHFNYAAPIDYITRIEKQSRFHPLIDAGAIIHVWLGEQQPDPESLGSLVKKVLHNTDCTQLAFSPEFTICEDCQRTFRGFLGTCPQCGSEDVYGITRIVGYFSKVQNWNPAKLGELDERTKGMAMAMALGRGIV